MTSPARALSMLASLTFLLPTLWACGGGDPPITCTPDCIGRCSGDDGCGGLCPTDNCALTGQTCGATGTCEGDCVPRTCAAQSAECGAPSDGCGALLSCGICEPGISCGADFQCGTAEPCPTGEVRNAAGVCVEEGSGCLLVEERGLSVHPPSGLRVTFRVTDCDREPIAALTPEQVSIINDATGSEFGAGGEGGGASAPSAPSSYGLFTVLSLDMSGSVFEGGLQTSVFDGAESFVRAVLDGSVTSRPRIAIQVFGRSAETRIVQPFTDNLDTLLATLTDLRANQTSLGSTNLYGAYQQALSAVLEQGQRLELVDRSIVLFTDGVHEAGDLANQRSTALAAKSEAERTGSLTAFSVYVGGADDTAAIEAIGELASSGADNFQRADADNLTELGRAFEAFATKLQRIAGSNYMVAVCTPVELGEGGLTIRINAGANSGELTVTYPTDELNGDVRPESCDPQMLIEQFGAGLNRLIVLGWNGTEELVLSVDPDTGASTQLGVMGDIYRRPRESVMSLDGHLIHTIGRNSPELEGWTIYTFDLIEERFVRAMPLQLPDPTRPFQFDLIGPDAAGRLIAIDSYSPIADPSSPGVHVGVLDPETGIFSVLIETPDVGEPRQLGLARGQRGFSFLSHDRRRLYVSMRVDDERRLYGYNLQTDTREGVLSAPLDNTVHELGMAQDGRVIAMRWEGSSFPDPVGFWQLVHLDLTTAATRVLGQHGPPAFSGFLSAHVITRDGLQLWSPGHQGEATESYFYSFDLLGESANSPVPLNPDLRALEYPQIAGYN